MKVALVIEHFDATRGNAERLAVWIANEVSRRGHEVHVVCHDVASRIGRYRQATQRASHDADRSQRAHPAAEVAHEGLRIHRLRGMRVNTAFGFRLFGRRARQWCREHQPDIVHSLTVACPGDIYHACSGVYAAMQSQAAASRPTEAAAALKRMMLRLPGKQRTLVALERKAVSGGPSHPPPPIISPCAMMTREFSRLYGVNGDRITELASPLLALPATPTSGQGLEISQAEARSWFRGHYRLAETDRVALFVAHDFRRKGLRFAIETIVRTATRWKLLIVGLDKVRPFVELAQQLGVANVGDDEPSEGPHEARVLFVGPTRDMQRLYAAADALLLPTFYDPWSLAALEALRHGLPVVSTEFLGTAEAVRRHRAGAIVASPREVDLMAKALDALPLAGTPESEALATRARAAGVGISPTAFIDSLIDLYLKVRDSK